MILTALWQARVCQSAAHSYMPASTTHLGQGDEGGNQEIRAGFDGLAHQAQGSDDEGDGAAQGLGCH